MPPIELTAAEFADAIGVKVAELAALEAAGLPTKSRREKKRAVTVYPWPKAIRWYVDHAVKTHARGIPPRVNQRDFAPLVGRSTRQVSNLTAENRITTVVEDGKRYYPLPLAVHQFIDYVVKQAGHKEEQLNELDKARLRKTNADAQRAELDLLEQQGELLRRTLVEEVVGELLQGVRSTMANIPSRWDQDVVGLKNATEARLRLKKLANECLTQLGAGAAQLARRVQVIGAADDSDEEGEDATRHAS